MAKGNSKRDAVAGTVDINRLQNVKDVKIEGNSISFLYQGNINNMIKQLADFDIADINISEPDFEEIFMHYYMGGKENDNI